MAKSKDARKAHRESILSAIFRPGSGPHKSRKHEGGAKLRGTQLADAFEELGF